MTFTPPEVVYAMFHGIIILYRFRIIKRVELTIAISLAKSPQRQLR